MNAVSTYLTPEDWLIVEEYKGRHIGLSMEIPTESPTHALVFRLGTKGLHYGVAALEAELDSVTSYTQTSISIGEIPFDILVDLDYYGENMSKLTSIPEEYCSDVFGKCITSMVKWIKRDFSEAESRVMV